MRVQRARLAGMKRKGWLLLVLAACLLLSGTTAFAAQPVATAHKADGIEMDGKLADWNLSDPIVLNSIEQMVRDGHFWNGPDDLSANVYIAWDEEAIYFAAEVTEDSIFGAIETLPLDGEDNFEIFLSTDPTLDPLRRQYATNDFMFYIITDGEYWDNAIDRNMVPKESRQRFISAGLDGGENVLEGSKFAAEKTTMGYNFEGRIPWVCFSNRNIPVYVPAVGDTVNFNFLITDISYPCQGTEFVPQIAWTGTLSIKTDPSQWGRLTFAE